jgi:hypothetical protein
MRSLALLVTLAVASWFACAQGSGAPSPAGQSVSPQAASTAERAVEGRHDKALARSKARAAKRAAKAASAESH